MDTQTNAEVVTALADVLNRHDLDAAVALFADDCVYLASLGPELDGRTFRGREEVRRGFEAMFDAYSDLRFDDLELLVDGDRAAPGWTTTATDATNGTPISVRGCDLFEFAGGKITRKDAFRKAREVV